MIKKTIYFGNQVNLTLRNAQLVISQPEKKEEKDWYSKHSQVTRPIEDIGLVLLDNKQINISIGALSALVENNTAIVTCDSKSMPVGMMLPLSGNTTQNERFRHQLGASLPLKKQLWRANDKS